MIIRQAAIFMISGYQFFKRVLPFASTCRFSPTCSEYTKEAVRHHGIIRGSMLGLGRILRCHPWNAGGYDSVSDQNERSISTNKYE